MKVFRNLPDLSNHSFRSTHPPTRSLSFQSFIFTALRSRSIHRSLHTSPATEHLSTINKRLSIVRSDEPTIYALSTAPGRAAIAIIRLSGLDCLNVYENLCPGKPRPKPRYATIRTLYDPLQTPTENSILDSNALVLYFPAPHTVTGEDVLEFHVHGGAAVVKSVLTAIPNVTLKGGNVIIRYAEPGEFTRRAFYNNRLDLLQIEALGDSLSAETEQQRLLAIRGSTSNQAEYYESWRQQLLAARGELEALIDFSEDQHFDESPAQLCAFVAVQVQRLRLQLRANIENALRGELLRNGINIALIGAPNAGKSSLLNQIVGREAAIVSSEPGTTRDVVDVTVDIGGFLCRFGDLAGIRKSSGTSQVGEIEIEGMRRAKERAFTADVVIAVFSAAVVQGRSGPEVSIDISSEILDVLGQCKKGKQKIIFALNKSDLFTDVIHEATMIRRFRRHPTLRRYITQQNTFPISCKNAKKSRAGKQCEDSDPGGIEEFLYDCLIPLFREMTSAAVPSDLQQPDSSNWMESLGATERQRLLLQDCLEYLENFLAEVQLEEKISNSAKDQSEIIEGDIDIVLAAESLRSAADCLSKITGKGEAGDVEEVLGVVFEKYVPFGTLIGRKFTDLSLGSAWANEPRTTQSQWEVSWEQAIA